MNQSQKISLENDPLEAIFALNMGDFMTEHLISKDLLTKIDSSVKDKIDRLKSQLKELISIYSLDKTLTLLGFNSEDEHVIYNAIAKTIAQMLDFDECCVFLSPEYVKASKEQDSLVLMGCSEEQKAKISYSLSDEENPIVKAFLKAESIEIKNYSDETKMLLTMPLANNWDKIGVISIRSTEQKEISQELKNLLESTANLFVTSIRLQKLIEQTEAEIKNKSADPRELRQLRTELTASIGDLGDEQQRFVESLATAVDKKSKTKQHSKNVAELARKISTHLELNEKTTDLIYYAGLLHNIGQISLPEEVFSCKDKPSKEIWQKIQNHPNIGVNLLMKINFLQEVIPYVHYHKERWDGKGIPEGLAGMSIPLGARIIAVSDAYQAMTSERPYRKPMSKDEVLKILKDESGEKWDPAIVNALYEILN